MPLETIGLGIGFKKATEYYVMTTSANMNG